MVPPEFKVVCLEETQGYTDKDIVKLAGKIHAVFLYDKSRATHCCEVTPSYELHYLKSVTSECIDDEVTAEEVEEHIRDANAHRESVQYVHCRSIDKVPEMYHVPFSENWQPSPEEYATKEIYEDILEHVIETEQANPNF